MEDTSSADAATTTSTNRRFRVRGKQLFLTYPRCTLSPDAALAQLQSLLGNRLSEWIIARENHKDGGQHLHIFLRLRDRLDTSDPHYLDLSDSTTSSTYHPNIQAARSERAVMAYVTKDGEFIASEGLSTSVERATRSGPNVWKRAREVAKESGVAEAIALLEEEPRACRDLSLYGERILKNLATLKPKRLKIDYDVTSFGWTIPWDRTTHSLILWGPTNCGKTSLAKALLPNGLLTRHMDLLRSFDPAVHEGIILDDMSLKHLHDEAQIALLDRHEDTQVHVRYSVAEIPAGTPLIITSNKQPDFIINTVNPAIVRRCTSVNVLAIGKYILEF